MWVAMRRHLLKLAAALALASTGSRLWAQSTLTIKVTEGDGATYPLGARATRGISVEVTDEVGRPVEGATVAFRLPDDGATGAFPSGGRTDVVTTKGDGVASVWGMQWNRVAGEMSVKIAATKGSAKAGTSVLQFLSPTAKLPEIKEKFASVGGGHKWLWVSLGVVGAAGAAVAATGIASKPAASATPASTVQIGTPTIVVGKP